MAAAQQVDERAVAGDASPGSRGCRSGRRRRRRRRARGRARRPVPRGAAVQAAVEDEPGADARRDHQVDQVARRRGRRRRRPRPARRGSRRCRRCTGTSSRRRSSSAAAMPTQPGRIARRADDAVGLVDRARAGPCRRRSRASRSTPASSSSLVDELGGGVERPRARRGRCRARGARSARIVRREVGDRDAQVVVAEVDADARRRRERSKREQDRRAAALRRRGRRPGSARSTTRPVGLQVGDEARDGRAREAGAARDLGARDRPLRRAARR